MLSEREWNLISNILLELYSIENSEDLFGRIMVVLHILIPYTKGYILMLDIHGNIVESNSYFVGMDDKTVKEYINYYYDEDYLKYLYEISIETTVYQDSKIISDEMRTETMFYKKFLKAIDGPFGCGILIIHNGRLLGIINLFKSGKLGDFTEKDIYILDVLKFHIENIVYRITKSDKHNTAVKENFEEAIEKFELTKREGEVLQLMCQGFSNAGICDMLTISMSTVKTHIYNIYTKTGVNNRTQLINMIYNNI